MNNSYCWTPFCYLTIINIVFVLSHYGLKPYCIEHSKNCYWTFKRCGTHFRCWTHSRCWTFHCCWTPCCLMNTSPLLNFSLLLNALLFFEHITVVDCCWTFCCSLSLYGSRCTHPARRLAVFQHVGRVRLTVSEAGPIPTVFISVLTVRVSCP